MSVKVIHTEFTATLHRFAVSQAEFARLADV